MVSQSVDPDVTVLQRAKAYRDMGYKFPRLLPDNTWVALAPLIYTWGIVTDLDERGNYKRRYCYEDMLSAAMEMSEMHSSKDEPKGWIATR